MKTIVLNTFSSFATFPMFNPAYIKGLLCREGIDNIRLYRYCPWMRGMATSQISCNNGIDKKASHVPL